MRILAIDRTDPSAAVSEASRGETRIARVLAVTLRRNRQRPAIDYEAFDPAAVPPEHRAALALLVTQMEVVEVRSPSIIAALARRVGLPQIGACFAAQVRDEVAHAEMLRRWLDIFGRTAPHPAVVVGMRAATWTQRDPWLAIRHPEMLMEFWACALLEELLPRVAEPVLRSILVEMRKDEERHKVIAVEAVRALHQAGSDRRLVARLFGPVVEKGTLMYFRAVFDRVLGIRCEALGLPQREILERALQESHDALCHAL